MSIKLEYKDVLDRCKQWSGGIEELRELGDVIQSVFNADQDKMAEKFCLALLKHDPPAFYKAKFYAYLSAFEAYDEVSYLHIAQSWIREALKQQHTLGWVAEEVEVWAQTIDQRLKSAVEQRASPELSLEGLSIGGMDGAMDGAGDPKATREHVHDTENCKMCQRMRGDEFPQPKPTAEELEALRKAKEELEATVAKQEKQKAAAKAKEVEERKRREQVAKIPKSARMKFSTQSFQKGTGTRGVLRSKKSMSNFDLFVQQQDKAEEQARQEEPARVAEESGAMDEEMKEAEEEPEEAEEPEERDERSMGYE
ncbi:hypothetical protein LTR15_007262 [Elasticomyces elasticus]|nr:hypothetical protein LTR15_007262 [Elasticomyces elasticus]